MLFTHHWNQIAVLLLIKVVYLSTSIQSWPGTRLFLISSQRQSLLLDPILGDDVELYPVTGVDLALGSRDEHIVNDVDGLLHSDWSLVRVLHVLLAHLVIEQRLKEGDCGAAGAVHILLTVPHRIVAVQAAAALAVQPAQDVGDVVREEPLVVEHR